LENDATLEDLFFHREKVRGVSKRVLAFLKKKERSDLSRRIIQKRGELSLVDGKKRALFRSRFGV
jgi:hypothetical protein